MRDHPEEISADHPVLTKVIRFGIPATTIAAGALYAISISYWIGYLGSFGASPWSVSIGKLRILLPQYLSAIVLYHIALGWIASFEFRKINPRSGGRKKKEDGTTDSSNDEGMGWVETIFSLLTGLLFFASIVWSFYYGNLHVTYAVLIGEAIGIALYISSRAKEISNQLIITVICLMVVLYHSYRLGRKDATSQLSVLYAKSGELTRVRSLVCEGESGFYAVRKLANIAGRNVEGLEFIPYSSLDGFAVDGLSYLVNKYGYDSNSKELQTDKMPAVQTALEQLRKEMDDLKDTNSDAPGPIKGPKVPASSPAIAVRRLFWQR